MSFYLEEECEVSFDFAYRDLAGEIVDFCLVMENLGGHFYKENQKVIDSAFAYLYKFREEGEKEGRERWRGGGDRERNYSFLIRPKSNI